MALQEIYHFYSQQQENDNDQMTLGSFILFCKQFGLMTTLKQYDGNQIDPRIPLKRIVKDAPKEELKKACPIQIIDLYYKVEPKYQYIQGFEKMYLDGGKIKHNLRDTIALKNAKSLIRNKSNKFSRSILIIMYSYIILGDQLSLDQFKLCLQDLLKQSQISQEDLMNNYRMKMKRIKQPFGMKRYINNSNSSYLDIRQSSLTKKKQNNSTKLVLPQINLSKILSQKQNYSPIPKVKQSNSYRILRDRQRMYNEASPKQLFKRQIYQFTFNTLQKLSSSYFYSKEDEEHPMHKLVEKYKNRSASVEREQNNFYKRFIKPE